MCGIVGVINPTNGYIQGIVDLVPDMLSVGTIRGPHSTGILKVVNGKTHWFKKTVPGWLFVEDKDFLSFAMSLGTSDFIVGHNRWATRGGVTVKNAHPFEYQHVTLVHNGTVSQVSELKDESLEVDSHMIAKCIAERGIEETKDFLWGAYSLVWYDSKEKTLNFLRNKERPMWFIHTRQKAIIFCSEPQMGVWCAERRGYIVERTEELPIDMLWSYKAGKAVPIETEMKKVWKTLPMPAPRQAEVFSLEERNTLKALSKTYKTGEVFKFSLNDFDDTNTRGRFVQVFGESPDNRLVTCVGNFAGQMEALYNVKTLLCGVITSVAISKKLKKVVLGLKTISITGEPDPFFVPSPVRKPATMSNPENHKQGILSGDSCDLCGHKITRANCDDPYLITDNGIRKIVCVSCYMDRPEHHSDLQSEFEGLRH